MYWISSRSIVKFVRKWAQKIVVSHASMTLNESQGQLHWYQNIEFSGLNHHTRFERSQSVNAQRQAKIKFIFNKIT